MTCTVVSCRSRLNLFVITYNTEMQSSLVHRLDRAAFATRIINNHLSLVGPKSHWFQAEGAVKPGLNLQTACTVHVKPVYI